MQDAGTDMMFKRSSHVQNGHLPILKSPSAALIRCSFLEKHQKGLPARLRMRIPDAGSGIKLLRGMQRELSLAEHCFKKEFVEYSHRYVLRISENYSHDICSGVS